MAFCNGVLLDGGYYDELYGEPYDERYGEQHGNNALGTPRMNPLSPPPPPLITLQNIPDTQTLTSTARNDNVRLTSEQNFKVKHAQKQLLLIMHAHRCKKQDRTTGVENVCNFQHCKAMKGILDHMTTCKAGKTCCVSHCASSRRIISHRRLCVRRDCPVCAPIKNRSQGGGHHNGSEVLGSQNQKRKLENDSGIGAKQKKVSSSSSLMAGEEDEDDDDKLCVVCLQNLFDTVLIPCGHLYMCFTCATAVKNKNAECPICRSYIKSILRVHTPS